MNRSELNKFIQQSISEQGNYTLLLSKEEGLSELSHSKITE